jgi:hypothetical protein
MDSSQPKVCSNFYHAAVKRQLDLLVLLRCFILCRREDPVHDSHGKGLFPEDWLRCWGEVVDDGSRGFQLMAQFRIARLVVCASFVAGILIVCQCSLVQVQRHSC